MDVKNLSKGTKLFPIPRTKDQPGLPKFVTVLPGETKKDVFFDVEHAVVVAWEANHEIEITGDRPPTRAQIAELEASRLATETAQQATSPAVGRGKRGEPSPPNTAGASDQGNGG